MAAANLSEYVIPNNAEVVLLNCQEAFDGLTDVEKHYSHHLSQACFQGGLIVLFQTSPESPGIFVLLQKLFRAESPEKVAALAKTVGFTDEEVEAFFIYAAAFYGNMGNYKSFGDTKFIPGVSKEKVELLINASRANHLEMEQVQAVWNYVKDRMFSLESRQRELGLGQSVNEAWSG